MELLVLIRFDSTSSDEQEHYKVNPSDPVEAIKFRMESAWASDWRSRNNCMPPVVTKSFQLEFSLFFTLVFLHSVERNILRCSSPTY
jgi:hypothetical protein